MMKKILFGLMAVAAMTGCNLFIDDDYANEAGFKNVPVHEGDGYDRPVTVQDGGCEVTYQYKSDVHVLTPEEQRYIVSVEQDPAGAFTEIHYREDTPAGVLPVAGEILMSTITDRFPWGLNHRVQYRVDEDGVVKFIATFAQLDEAFEKLEFSGQMTTQEEEEFYVDAEVLSDDSTALQPLARLTRANDEEELTQDGVKVVLKDRVQEFTLPLPTMSFGADLPNNIHGELKLPSEGNYMKVTNVLDFDKFSLGESQFIVHITQTVEERTTVEVTGGFTAADKRLRRFQPLTGKAIKVGPVVLVLFVNIDFKATVDIIATATFSRERITENDYTVNLLDMSMTKKSEVKKDTGWTFPALDVKVELNLSVEFQFGIGIYGKIISVRFILVPGVTFSISAPTNVKVDGVSARDISTRPGPKIEFSVKLKIGVYLDLSLKNILSSLAEVGTAEQKLLLKQLEADAKQTSEYYQSVVDKNNELYDPNKKGNGKKSGEEEPGLYKEFTLFSRLTTFPWYPAIDDDMYYVRPVWHEDTRRMDFIVLMKIKDGGLFVDAFGRQLKVKLRLTRRDHLMGYVESRTTAGYVREGEIYSFALQTQEYDGVINCTPCYFDASDKLVAVDKALVVNPTNPSVDMVAVVPDNSFRDRFSDKSKNKGYTYLWHLQFHTDLQVRGAEHIMEFGVKDAVHGTKHDSVSVPIGTKTVL